MLGIADTPPPSRRRGGPRIQSYLNMLKSVKRARNLTRIQGRVSLEYLGYLRLYQQHTPGFSVPQRRYNNWKCLHDQSADILLRLFDPNLKDEHIRFVMNSSTYPYGRSPATPDDTIAEEIHLTSTHLPPKLSSHGRSVFSFASYLNKFTFTRLILVQKIKIRASILHPHFAGPQP